MDMDTFDELDRLLANIDAYSAMMADLSVEEQRCAGEGYTAQATDLSAEGRSFLDDVYTTQMTELSLEGKRFIDDFDDTLLDDTSMGYANGTNNFKYPSGVPVSPAQFSKRIALPPPRPSAPRVLYVRLLRELEFPEASTILSTFELMNMDLFSCLPRNEDLYRNAALLSGSVTEVIEASEIPIDGEIDLNAHGSKQLPIPPSNEWEIPNYVEAVQQFFLSELRAREESYLKLFLGYCRAIVNYIKSAATRGVRGCRIMDRKSEANKRMRRMIADRYYREAARLAKVLYLHLYLSVAREISSRLCATQMQVQNVFVYMRYEWQQYRQFTCLFHPIMFNHGVVLLNGEPLQAQKLREVNYIRFKLGLPVIRCGLVEEHDKPLVEEPRFYGNLPRSSGFLTELIRSKMEAYSELRPTSPSSISNDHTYAKQLDKVNFGSTREAILDTIDTEGPLPGDPIPALSVSVRNLPAETLFSPDN
ncbi:UL48 [anatid alphaherpesvirus 1]|uniref:Alpha trans-inducing protein n=2 Tax=anatid alphaherpesvirus 1 TaxID=104388 RepID=B4XS08_9ALPH|nr:UL48 [Anatid alphaherpesvirus 1]ABU49245.1 UL48 [Anatid alphaherpesvirus 1]